MKFNCIGIVYFFILHSFCTAQTDTTFLKQNIDDSSGFILNPIVVISSRTLHKLSLSPFPVSFIPQSQIKQMQSRSTPEMLTGTPGIWVQKTNHGGGSPFIRGLTGNQVLTLVDGIRLNNATYRYGPNQYLSTIDPWSLYSAETLRSSGSVLYGSDAMGGVVYLQTEKPGYAENKNKFNGTVYSRFMSRNMEKTIGVKMIYGDRNWAGMINGNISEFGHIVAGNGKVQHPTAYGQQSWNTNWRVKIAKNQELTLAYQYLRQDEVDLYDQVTQRGYAISQTDPLKRQLAYLRWTADFSNPLFSKLIVTAFQQQFDEGRIRQKTNSPIVTTEFDKTVTRGFTAEFVSEISDRHEAGTGLDFYADKVNSNAFDKNILTQEVTAKRGLYPDNARMTSIAVYHRHRWKLERWQLEGGIRANIYWLNMEEQQFGDVNLSPTAVVGNFSAMYYLENNWKLAASISTAFRAPNINDLGSFGKFDFGIEVPTTSLEPEKSFNKEIGIKKINQRMMFSVSVFHNRLTNLIDRVPSEFNGDSLYNGDPVYKKENIGEAVIYGSEFELILKPANKWDIFSHLTYTYGQNKSAKEPLRRIPPLFGKTGFRHRPFNRFYYEFEILFAGNQNRLAAGDKSDHRINPNGTPGWVTIQFRAGYNWRWLSVQSGIENLFDQSYRMHGSGIDGYGRTGWIRIACSF
jgi:hemoglobin/transferrin/lactoferrin receptor protein